MSAVLAIAVVVARGWTWLYTCALPQAIRQRRRDEVASDLWELQHDPAMPSAVMVPMHILGRVLFGAGDDLLWALESHTPPWRWLVGAVATSTALIAIAIAGPRASATELPSVAARARLADLAIETPPPPPPPPEMQGGGDDRDYWNSKVWAHQSTREGGAARATPLEPIGALLEAFRTHSIVMLGHAHGNIEKARFQLSLVRDSRFAAVVNDIVEECGNSRYQETIDRFVRGEDVAYMELRRVWEDAFPVNTNCDLPMYEAFYRAVRTINAGLPRERQIRVLLGEVPIDWNDVHSYAEIAKWEEQRSSHAAALVRREVLAKGRRALVIYGEMHAQRRNERTNFETADNIGGLLEADGKTRIFNVWPQIGAGKPDLTALRPDAAAWKVPSLVVLRGTTLGALDYLSFYTSDFRLTIADGKPRRLPRDQWQPMRMEDQFNALLYLGSNAARTYETLPAARCADAAFMEMRERRMSMVPQGTAELAELRKYCAAHPPAR